MTRKSHVGASQTAATASSLASEAATVAREGGRVVHDVVESMGQINNPVQGIRLTINSGTGLVSLTLEQAGIRN